MPSHHRALPALKLSSDPLALVLGQVRISPILRMGSYVPDIQEDLRKRGYPRFSRMESQEISLGPQVQVSTNSRWLFSTKENTEAVVLGPDFITLETTIYDTFDEYIAKFEKVLEVIGRSTDISLVQRFGLRYVNLIEPEEGETLGDYLHPGLLGLDPARLEVLGLLYRYEARGRTASGELVVRVAQQEGGQILPADLSGTSLLLEKRKSVGVPVTNLDIDHYATAEQGFVPKEIGEFFWELHYYTDLAFRASVTEFALKSWGAAERSNGN